MKKGVAIYLDIDDIIQIEKYKPQFESMTDEELVLFYFNEQNDKQLLEVKFYRLCALKQILKERFGDSPIKYNGKKLKL